MSAPSYQDRRSRAPRRQLTVGNKRRYPVRPTVRCDDESTPLLVKIATAVVLFYLIVMIIVVL